MKMFVYNADLVPLLFPQYSQMLRGFFSDNPKLLFKQETTNPREEYASLLRMYGDTILFITKKADAADVAYTSAASVKNYLIDVRKFPVSVTVDVWLEKADEDEAFAFLKMSVAQGKWDREIMKRTEGVYKLYEAVSKGQRDTVIDTWFSLLESRSAASLLASIITFIGKIRKGPDESTSKWMHATLSRSQKMCD